MSVKATQDCIQRFLPHPMTFHDGPMKWIL